MRIRFHKPLSIAACVLLLAGCNAFADADDVGPSPDETNVGPGNNTSDNNTSGNISTNNIIANNISTNNIIANNIFPANNTSPNNCLDAPCGFCDNQTSYVCDDPACPTMVSEEPCPDGTICDLGQSECVSCSTCDPEMEVVCPESGSSIEACVKDPTGCAAILTYDCDINGNEFCTVDLEQPFCELLDRPCDPEGPDLRCGGPHFLFRCTARTDTEFQWELDDSCADLGGYCDPDTLDCTTEPHNR